MTLIEIVEALTAERDHHRDLAHRLDQALAAIVNLDGDTENVAAIEAPKPEPPARKPPTKGQFTCPECGRLFGRPNGLTRHINQTHRTKANGHTAAKTSAADPRTARLDEGAPLDKRILSLLDDGVARTCRDITVAVDTDRRLVEVQLADLARSGQLIRSNDRYRTATRTST